MKLVIAEHRTLNTELIRFSAPVSVRSWYRRGHGAKQAPATGRPCHAGGRGQAQRQAQDRTYREIGEGLRFDRVAVPTDCPAQAHRRAEPPAERRHERRVVPPTTADQPLAGRSREISNRSRDSLGSHLGQGGRTVLQRKTLVNERSEVVAIERFRRWAIEEGGCQKPRDMRRRSAPGAGERTIDVGGGSGPLAYPVIDQRVAGCGVEGENFRRLADPRDVRDATDVEDRERLWQRRGDSGVEQRSERRPFTARGDIGRAEIGNHVEPEETRQQRAVAQLPGAVLG